MRMRSLFCAVVMLFLEQGFARSHAAAAVLPRCDVRRRGPLVRSRASLLLASPPHRSGTAGRLWKPPRKFQGALRGTRPTVQCEFSSEFPKDCGPEVLESSSSKPVSPLFIPHIERLHGVRVAGFLRKSRRPVSKNCYAARVLFLGVSYKVCII